MGEERIQISLLKMILDIVLINMVGWCVFIIDLFSIPYHRGFFCSDQRLMYPVKKSTVSFVPLICCGFLIPLATMLLTEFVQRKQDPNQYSLLGINIPNWFYNFYCHYGIFCFGEATAHLITDATKHTVGRLRPYFLTGCVPNVCKGNPDPNKYHVKWKCTEGKYFRHGSKSYDPILSFPSGHSNMAMYAAIYLILYLQSRFTWEGSKLLRPVIQLLLFGTAVWVCLTRLQDYKHHWEDVLAGMTIGSGTAFICAIFLSQLFKDKSKD